MDTISGSVCLTFFNFIITLLKFECMHSHSHSYSHCTVFNALYITEKGTKGHILTLCFRCTSCWCSIKMSFQMEKRRGKKNESGGSNRSSTQTKKQEQMNEHECERIDGGEKKREDSGKLLLTPDFFRNSLNTNSFGCSTLNNAINSALTVHHLLHLLLLQS